MKVFFSHSSKQKAVVRQIAGRLKAPLSPWIDEWEIVAGDQLLVVLESTIAVEAAFLVACLDTNALRSQWVLKELQWALQKECSLNRHFIVPIILEAEVAVEAKDLFGDRVWLQCHSFQESDVNHVGDRLYDELFKLVVSWHTPRTSLRAPSVTDSSSVPVQAWRKRSELSPEEWRQVFSRASHRIWLLGHAMKPVFDPVGSGRVIEERIRAGADVRLVILDPDDVGRGQIDEIVTEMKRLDLRGKIRETLTLARQHAAPSPGSPPDRANLSIGVTSATIHNSIVIVDDRIIVTIYTHSPEMGDQGVTLDLHMSTDSDLCAFFEHEFKWHWSRSRPSFDPIRAFPGPIKRILNHEVSVKRSIDWFIDPESLGGLPAPHLAVLFPTFRCTYNSRAKHVADASAVPLGPHSDKLLCSNCMFGSQLNSRPLDMPSDKFETLCAQLISFGVKQIEVSGGGEPLHHPKFNLLLDSIARRQSETSGAIEADAVTFGLISNATILTEKLPLNLSASALCQAFSYIRWSWPEDAESDSAFRANLLSGIRRFVEGCELDNEWKTERCRIGVKVLVTRQNAKDRGQTLLLLIQDLIEAGVDHVKVRTLRSPDEPDEEELRHISDGLARLESTLWFRGNLSGVKTLEVDIERRYVPPDYKCMLSSLMTVIEPSGDVRMCWNDMERRPARVIGNVFAHPFAELWGSEVHHRICKSMNAISVCNSSQGCHCRFVGYQELAGRLLPLRSSNADDVYCAVPHDSFL